MGHTVSKLLGSARILLTLALLAVLLTAAGPAFAPRIGGNACEDTINTTVCDGPYYVSCYCCLPYWVIWLRWYTCGPNCEQWYEPGGGKGWFIRTHPGCQVTTNSCGPQTRKTCPPP